jgi:hypothetical protein
MLPRSPRAEYFLVSRVVACSREPIAGQIYRRRIYDAGVINLDNPLGSRIKARGRLAGTALPVDEVTAGFRDAARATETVVKMVGNCPPALGQAPKHRQIIILV